MLCAFLFPMLTLCGTADDTVHAASCTQTTESSRLLRNTPHETPHRKESTTCDSSTRTIFTSGLDHSTPSGRRPTRRIRSLPCPYSASGTTSNSSRRSTIDGSASRRVGSVPASSTRTRDREPLSVDPSSIGSSAGSPSDRLGSLMTQLGERFSNRNEARKRRAEMQDKLAHQKRQAEAGRLQRVRQEAEERERLRSKQGHTLGSESQRRPQAMAVQQQFTVQQTEPRCGKDDSTRSGANAHDKADVKIIKPRHPLAPSDVNHMTNTVNPLPCPTASVGLQKYHNPENTSSSKRPPAHLGRTIAPPDARPPAFHLVPPVASHTTTTTHKAYQGQLSVQSTVAAATSRTTATISKQHVTLAQTDHPVIISEPDTDTGHHQHSDTSFDSLTDMDGLFSAGGEEVEALFRACDGF